MKGHALQSSRCNSRTLVFPALGGSSALAQAVAAGNRNQTAIKLVDQCGVAFKAHQYPLAINLCKQAADLGDPEGIEGLAIVYREVKQCSLAAQYYRLNAPTRPAAMNSLGELYWLGSRFGCQGFPHDAGKARTLFEDAAKRGWKQAWANLGWIDELGDGVPHNRQKAIAELRVAAPADEWNKDVMIALQQPDAPAHFNSPEELGQYAADVRFRRWMASQPSRIRKCSTDARSFTGAAHRSFAATEARTQFDRSAAIGSIREARRAGI